MHEPLAMGVIQRIGDLAEEGQRLVDRQLGLAVQPLAEGFAGDVGHDVEQQS